MKKLRFLWVGKLRKPFWQEAAAYYWKSLSRFHALEEAVLRDAPAGLGPGEARAVEGRRILDKAGPADFLVVLDEGGEALRSVELAQRLRAWTEAPGTIPCFVVGGAHGLGAEVLAAARVRLALGPMTLPHELARVLLLEQLYRAASILRQLPYHHA